jgi:hypothetical protein
MPPDLWAAFLLHQAEGGLRSNFCYQAITLTENCPTAVRVKKCYGDFVKLWRLSGHNTQGGLIEPELLELMRLRGANLNACTYCATVRLQPVANSVKPKEAALGLRDISGMTKPQALECGRGMNGDGL